MLIPACICFSNTLLTFQSVAIVLKLDVLASTRFLPSFCKVEAPIELFFLPDFFWHFLIFSWSVLAHPSQFFERRYFTQCSSPGEKIWRFFSEKFCSGRKNSIPRYLISKYGFCEPQNHHAAVSHLRQKNLELRKETADDLVHGSELCFKCNAYVSSFLLPRNIRDILRKNFLQNPKSLFRGDFWVFLLRLKHLSATQGRKAAEKFSPAWCFAENLWNFVFLL